MDRSKIASVRLAVARGRLEGVQEKYANVLGSELTVKRGGIEYICEFSGMLGEFLASFSLRETDEIIKKIELQISNISSQDLPEEFIDILKKIKELRKKKFEKIWKLRFGSRQIKKRPK